MDLSRVLLVCAVAQALIAVGVARYRRDGTIVDLLFGALASLFFFVFASVTLSITSDLTTMGVFHLAYLTLVVSIPMAAALLAAPHWRDAEYRTPILMVVLTGVGVILAAVGLWATHVAPNQLRVDNLGLGANGLSKPLVVGVLADLQTPNIGDHEKAAVAAIVDGEPDLVVIPGDIAQLGRVMTQTEKGEFVGLLREFTTVADLVVIVPGNNDRLEELQEIANSIGALLLVDDVASVAIDGQPVTIIGLDEPFDDEVIDPEILGRVDELTEQDVVLMVSHRPDPILTLGSNAPVDLFIAGHTHGGQISLPFFGPLLTLSDVPREVAAGGLHLVNGHPIYVSTGVGIERGQAPQVRFGVAPSVGLITIVPS